MEAEPVSNYGVRDSVCKSNDQTKQQSMQRTCMKRRWSEAAKRTVGEASKVWEDLWRKAGRQEGRKLGSKPRPV